MGFWDKPIRIRDARWSWHYPHIPSYFCGSHKLRFKWLSRNWRRPATIKVILPISSFHSRVNAQRKPEIRRLKMRASIDASYAFMMYQSGL